MPEVRKTAEEYFKKGSAMKDLPVCRPIAENRRDGRTRDLKDEERIITGILMTGCDLGSDLACGFFRPGTAAWPGATEPRAAP